jgi:hypothetical protein
MVAHFVKPNGNIVSVSMQFLLRFIVRVCNLAISSTETQTRYKQTSGLRHNPEKNNLEFSGFSEKAQ